MYMKKYLLLFLGITLFLYSGCSASKNIVKSNNEVLKIIENRAEMLIDKELNLKGCIDIALENNLSIKTANLNQSIAILDRRVAFSSFLPAVNLGFSYRDWNKQPEALAGPGVYRKTQDRTIFDKNIEIQMPLLVPATWYMYSAYKRGENIQELLIGYTKKMIVLETIVLYYKVFEIEESIKYMNSQIAAAKSLYEEFELLQKEDMILDWQLEELKVYLLSKYSDLRKLEREYNYTKSELLSHLGLSPFEKLSLIDTDLFKVPENELEELVMIALQNNEQLKIAVENIQISNDELKIALTNFIPVLSGFANISHTSNDYMRYANQTLLGLSGVVTLFNGFKNVNEYRRAKANREKYFLNQEETILKVMLQVIESYNNLNTVSDILELTKLNLSVSENRLDNIKSKHKEGLVSSTDLLESIASRDYAYTNYIQTKYRHQVAIAALNTIINRNIIEKM